MEWKDAFKAIIGSAGYTQSSLAEKMGVKQPSVSNVISYNNPKMNVAVKYLSELGYQVVLAPIGVKLPERCYTLEASEK